MNRIDETGNKHGKLTVIKYAGRYKNGAALWRCKCDCGGEAVVTGSALRRGSTRGCGCLRIKDIAGNKYGKLTVIKRIGKAKNGAYLWECKCDCGEKAVFTGNSLKTGHGKSCGCLKLPYGQAAFNNLFGSMKKGAKKRGYKFELSRKQVKELVDLPCFYCGLPPSNISRSRGNNGNYIYSGIDRVDNGKGYNKKNSVPCCFECNKVKKAKSVLEFSDWLKRLIKHNKWDYRDIDNIQFIAKKKI